MVILSHGARKVLEVLKKLKSCDLRSLSEQSGLTIDQVRKAVEELKENRLVQISVKIERKVKLGKKLADLGYKLPERIIVEKLIEKGGNVEINELIKLCSLSLGDFLAGIGKAKEKGWIESFKVGKKRFIRLLNAKESPEEVLIKKILSKGEILWESLKENEIRTLKKLMNRPNLIKEVILKEYKVTVTNKGLKIKLPTIKTVISSLTPELIKTGKWREVEFEKYNLNVRSYPLYPGRFHPLRETIEEIREIFISMGFEEVEDPLIQLAFWNFDALFQPQDHPARDMQDTFYIDYPESGDMLDNELVKRVKETHENGWITGSTGWGGKWDINEAKKLVLRTHTTVVTIKEVYKTGNRPKKIFTIGSVFRNEKMDFKHSVEFFQIDGVIIDKNANIRQLMGIMKEFYKRIGLKKVKFMPSYFPYTEPSIQTSVYVEKLNDWIELCGMGIFRPEVTKPLGVDWPVLAWGGGIERLVMIRYDLEDIRDLYRNDLGWLRRRPQRLLLT